MGRSQEYILGWFGSISFYSVVLAGVTELGRSPRASLRGRHRSEIGGPGWHRVPVGSLVLCTSMVVLSRLEEIRLVGIAGGSSCDVCVCVVYHHHEMRMPRGAGGGTDNDRRRGGL